MTDKRYKHVKVVSFAKYDEGGRINEIRCKGCGAVISGIRNKLMSREFREDGRIIERYSEAFRRFANYREAFIVMDDGSAHHTHGCARCLHDGMSLETANEFFLADIEESGVKYTDRQMARKPVAVKTVKIEG